MKMGGIEIYRNIYIKEQQWINRLMDVEFRGRDILLKQFSKAKIIYKQEYAFISLKFTVSRMPSNVSIIRNPPSL